MSEPPDAESKEKIEPDLGATTARYGGKAGSARWLTWPFGGGSNIEQSHLCEIKIPSADDA